MPVQVQTQPAYKSVPYTKVDTASAGSATSTPADANGTSGPQAQDYASKTQAAQSDLATMSALQSQMLTTHDKGTLSQLASSYATAQADMLVQLKGGALDASLDGSNTEGAGVSNLVQQATALDQSVISTLGPTDSHVAGLTSVDGQINAQGGIANGVAEQRGAADQTITWGNISSPATLSVNGASGDNLADFPSTNSDGSLQTAPNISTGTTWANNSSTNAFGTGTPQIVFGQQAQTGDCSSLSAFNAVACHRPAGALRPSQKSGYHRRWQK